MPAATRLQTGSNHPLAAAVLGEIRDDAVHAGQVSRVDDLAVEAPLRHQPGALEMLEVEAQRRRRHAQAFSNHTCGQTVRAALDQQPTHRQPVLVRQGSQGVDDVLGVQDGLQPVMWEQKPVGFVPS